MNIAVLGHKQIPSREGGVEVVTEALCTRMAARGHTVVCYNRKTAMQSSREDYRSVRRRAVPTIRKKGLSAVSSSFFAAVFSAFSPAQVVHIHGEGPAFWCWIPRLAGKRVVVTVHGLDWQREKWKGTLGARYIRWGERAAVNHADGIIVLSRNVQTYFADTYGRKTLWIPNGVTRPRPATAEGIAGTFGLERQNYFLFLGRLVPEKGIHELIAAFRAVQTEKLLVIAGAPSDSDGYVEKLHTQAAEDPRILFTGFVQGQLLEELYSNAYAFVLPSHLEGMPMSLLEAMSYDNCCLVSDIPECTEVVENRAMTFPAGDVQALQACLQRLADHPELAEAYRAGAADFICGKYNWDEITERTLKVYQ